MIVNSEPSGFIFPDYIGNFIEDKYRQQGYFIIDDLLYEKISEHTNLSELKTIVELCDYSLEHVNIDDITTYKLLDLRDYVIIRIQNLERQIRMVTYVRSHAKSNIVQGYSHSMQVLLPEENRVTNEEMNIGYIPKKGEPIEYECGCLTMRYNVPCDCYHSCKCVIKICDEISCNEKKYPEIMRSYMCKNHKILAERKYLLECELITIKKELVSINYFNSLDYKNMHAKMIQPINKKRLSRFPWKNEL
jgi:hypothetical protein